MSKKGFAPPNHTQTPNEFYDETMLEIDSLSEMKVTCAIIRQTFGWHREEKELSHSMLVALTGLSKPSVNEGIQAGLRRGTISRRKVGNTYTYKLVVKNLNQDNEVNQPSILSEDTKESEPITAKNPNQSEYDIKEKKEKGKKETDSSSSSLQSKKTPATPIPSLTDSLSILLKLFGTNQYQGVQPHHVEGWIEKYGEDAIRASLKPCHDYQMQLHHKFPTANDFAHYLKAHHSKPAPSEEKPDEPSETKVIPLKAYRGEEEGKKRALELAAESRERLFKALGANPDKPPPKPGQLDAKHADGVAVTAGLKEAV